VDRFAWRARELLEGGDKDWGSCVAVARGMLWFGTWLCERFARHGWASCRRAGGQSEDLPPAGAEGRC